MANNRIGIALSGGGVRAAVFHFGVLRFLAEKNLLENVKFISTVSGGSLAVGVIHAAHGNSWPTSFEFLENRDVLKERICTSSIQRKFIVKSFFSRRIAFLGRARYLSKYIEIDWKVTGTLDQLPSEPRWIINGTCYETGKNWIFSHKRMGDYVSGYVENPKIKISHCLAASAAVPGLIGPLKIDTTRDKWFNFDNPRNQQKIPHTPKFRKLKIWDGGVYDNLGVEALFKPDRGIRDGIDFLIVADASMVPDESNQVFSRKPPFYIAPARLIDIATEQIRSLRTRILMNYIEREPSKCAIFSMGYTSEQIKDFCKISNSFSPPENHMSKDEVKTVAKFPTTLKSLSEKQFDNLERHGYEVAMATLNCYRETLLSSPTPR